MPGRPWAPPAACRLVPSELDADDRGNFGDGGAAWVLGPARPRERAPHGPEHFTLSAAAGSGLSVTERRPPLADTDLHASRSLSGAA